MFENPPLVTAETFFKNFKKPDNVWLSESSQHLLLPVVLGVLGVFSGTPLSLI